MLLKKLVTLQDTYLEGKDKIVKTELSSTLLYDNLFDSLQSYKFLPTNTRQIKSKASLTGYKLRVFAIFRNSIPDMVWSILAVFSDFLVPQNIEKICLRLSDLFLESIVYMGSCLSGASLEDEKGFSENEISWASILNSYSNT